jgi:multisubunit Na+/H+ antiporter MnhB subunit
LRENRKVANKLGFYTVLMLTVPIITFYICFYFLFSNKSEPLAWSGFAAVGAANIIVAAYVYSAFSEPDEVEVDARVGSVGKFDNDASRPRVGAFKQRTD